MRHIRRLLILAGLIAVFALVLGGRERELSMHEDDWPDLTSGKPRRYRSPGHALHHARELLGLTRPATEVYLLRAISPAFREQIMIVTAMSNDCSP